MSEDYTPTTEQTRRAYVTGMRQAFIASAGEHGDEFDRWLSTELVAARRAGREEQREADARIAEERDSWTADGAEIAAAIRAAEIEEN